jgi:hypothetical protein
MGITQITQEVNSSQTTPWKKKKYLLICKRGRNFLALYIKNQTPLTFNFKKSEKCFLLKNPP